MPILFFIYLEKIANIRKYRKIKMMNISPIVNSVKCTVLAYSGNPAMLFAYTVWQRCIAGWATGPDSNICTF